MPNHPAVTDTLAEAQSVVEPSDWATFKDPEALVHNAVVQPLMVISGTSIARALIAEGIQPNVCAGLSIGAFGAAVCSGALSFADALRLVKLRGNCMETAYPQGYGLAAIVGLTQEKVETLVSACQSAEKPLWIANYNARDQFVVAGSDEALALLTDRAKLAGARTAKHLYVNVPSHCPLMDSVSIALQTAFQDVNVARPRIAYVSNSGGRVIYDADGVRNDLINSVSHAVLWSDASEVMVSLGTRFFMEMLPGHVLSHLAQAAYPDIPALSMDGTPLNVAQEIVSSCSSSGSITDSL